MYLAGGGRGRALDKSWCLHNQLFVLKFFNSFASASVASVASEATEAEAKELKTFQTKRRWLCEQHVRVGPKVLGRSLETFLSLDQRVLRLCKYHTCRGLRILRDLGGAGGRCLRHKQRMLGATTQSLFPSCFHLQAEAIRISLLSYPMSARIRVFVSFTSRGSDTLQNPKQHSTGVKHAP